MTNLFINKKINSTQGYTLIELLLVVGLIAISVGVTSDILLNIVRSYSKTQVVNEIEQQANFVGLKLEKEIRNADDATIIMVNVIRLTPKSTPTSFICYRLNGTILQRLANGTSICSGGTGWQNLTQSGVGNVSIGCIGSCFSVNGTAPKRVSIGLRFTQGSGSGTAFTGNIEITNTIVLRQTYD